jgi:2',3'-cyclic-nucleotide 2'-phosphodiesterase
MNKILLIGDIMGRPGRAAAAQVLPLWKQEHQPDVIIGNVENLTHGKGIISAHIEDMNALGFDVYTSGNHVFDSGPRAEECFQKFHNITRPANYVSLSEGTTSPSPREGRVGEGLVPGQGFYRFSKNNQQYLVINLGGQVFFEKQFRGEIANPFFAFDEIYQAEAQKDDIIIVDLHAEATSEKNAFAWHVDGRATIMYGTHTHIPTADTKIMPGGTAFQTDIGMTGARDSVLGVKPENSLAVYLGQGKFKLEVPEEGPAIANALLVELDGNKVIRMERLQQEINI